MRIFRHYEKNVMQAIEDGRLRIEHDGTVWRDAIIVTTGRHRGIRTAHITPCTPRRAETINKDGYFMVYAVVNGISYRTPAHRLVWQYFYGDVPEGMEINHIDGNKKNNHPLNLEAVTSQGNCRHAITTGLRTRKLTVEQVEEIRAICADRKMPRCEIARRFDISQGHLSNIASGRNYPYVEAERSRLHGRKLTHEERVSIKERYQPYKVPARVLAEEYGVSVKAVYLAIKKR